MAWWKQKGLRNLWESVCVWFQYPDSDIFEDCGEGVLPYKRTQMSPLLEYLLCARRCTNSFISMTSDPPRNPGKLIWYEIYCMVKKQGLETLNIYPGFQHCPLFKAPYLLATPTRNGNTVFDSRLQHMVYITHCGGFRIHPPILWDPSLQMVKSKNPLLECRLD